MLPHVTIQALLRVCLTIVHVAAADDYPYCAIRYRRLCQGKGQHVACQFTDGEPGVSCHNYTVIKFSSHLQHFVTHFINRRRQHIAAGQEKVRGGLTLPRPQVMMLVEWDRELAFLSKRLADQCHFVHDECRATVRYPYAGQTVGEVRWRRLGLSDEESSQRAIRRILDAWWGEKRRVDPQQLTQPFKLTSRGTVWGDFSQLAVWSLRAVGCGAIRHGADYPRLLLVCDYSHTNMLGQRTLSPGKLSPCPMNTARRPRSAFPLLCAPIRRSIKDYKEIVDELEYLMEDDSSEDQRHSSKDIYIETDIKIPRKKPVDYKDIEDRFAGNKKYFSKYTFVIPRKSTEDHGGAEDRLFSDEKHSNEDPVDFIHQRKRPQDYRGAKHGSSGNQDKQYFSERIDDSRETYQESGIDIETGIESTETVMTGIYKHKESTRGRIFDQLQDELVRRNKGHFRPAVSDKIVFRKWQTRRPNFGKLRENHEIIDETTALSNRQSKLHGRTEDAVEERTKNRKEYDLLARQRWKQSRNRPKRPGANALLNTPQIEQTEKRSSIASLMLDKEDLDQLFRDTGFNIHWRNQKQS